MIRINKNKQVANDQDIDRNNGKLGGDDYPHCEGGACANVAEDDEVRGDISADVTGEQAEQQFLGEKAAEEWRDKYLRLSAEFDNYRKRTLKEKVDLALLGGETVIKAMLPVLDDMDRALEVMRTADDIASVRTGIELISHKLNEILKHQGLMEIEAAGIELDTDFHEAVAKTPCEDSDKGKIVDIIQKGYTLKDKVIRHTKVVVGE